MTNITDRNENLKKATYAEIFQANKTPPRRLIKTNNTDHNNKPNIHEKHTEVDAKIVPIAVPLI